MDVKIKTGFTKLSEGKLSEAAQKRFDKMTDNSVDYPTPNPVLADIKDALGKFDTAKAFKGGPIHTALKKQLKKDLIELLNEEALYVKQQCGNDEAKALRSGYDIWKTKKPVGVLPKPKNFDLRLGKNTGWVEAFMDSFGKKANSYIFRYSYDGSTDPETWTVVTSTSAMRIIMGLVALKKVYVQGAGVGSSPYLVWSDIRSIVVL